MTRVRETEDKKFNYGLTVVAWPWLENAGSAARRLTKEQINIQKQRWYVESNKWTWREIELGVKTY